jgi:hypothetical protein
MGLFNNYYGRSYSDRKPNTYSNTNRPNNKYGGQQQRRGLESWSGGSSATSSPEPIDFSVNDIVFEKRTVTMSGDSMAGRSQQPMVNWRQNDIDFGRRSQLIGQQQQQRGGQRQRNSVSSDDCSDSNSYPSPNRQYGLQQSGGYVNSNQSGRYNSSFEPANGQLGGSYSCGRQPGYNSSSYGKQLGCNSGSGSSCGSQMPNYNGKHQMNSSYANGYNSYEMQPPAPGYSSYVGHQQPTSGHSSYKSQDSHHQQVCTFFTNGTVHCTMYNFLWTQDLSQSFLIRTVKYFTFCLFVLISVKYCSTRLHVGSVLNVYFFSLGEQIKIFDRAPIQAQKRIKIAFYCSSSLLFPKHK